jgi:hypothetical protein
MKWIASQSLHGFGRRKANTKRNSDEMEIGAFRFSSRILNFFFLISFSLAAQIAATLSGVITDNWGKAVPNADVSVKNTASGESASARTDANGNYSVSNLAAGNYTVSVSAQSLATKESNVSITGAAGQTLNLTLTAAPEPGLPSAPSAAPSAPSLESLGFSQQQMQGNPKLQAELNRRAVMLKIHQRLGLITAAPMITDFVAGPMAKAKGRHGQVIRERSSTNLDLHAALGSAKASLYFTTASFAIFGPRIPGEKKHGAIRVHEALVSIHGPGMVLTPILGAMAFNQENSGEKVHGAASAHGGSPPPPRLPMVRPSSLFPGRFT